MLFSMCRERDSNPHSHHWPRDFKSLVSTNSTIAASYLAKNARFRLQRYYIILIFPNINVFFLCF